MSRDNRLALLSRMKSRGSNDVYLVDLSSKKEVNLTSHDGPGEFAGRFSHDAKTVYLASNKDRDTEAVAKEKRPQRRGRDNRRTGHASGVDLEHSGKSELAFVDLRTGENELWAAAADGAGVRSQSSREMGSSWPWSST